MDPEILAKKGDWVALRRTLAFDEGMYRIVEVTPSCLKIMGEDGKSYMLTREQFKKYLLYGPTAPKRRTGARATYFEQDEGVLSSLGYHVGVSGLSRDQRRSILAQLFEMPFERLPQVGDPYYMAQWGPARSPERLGKMRNGLDSFAQNARARRDPPRAAIQHWEEDLDWLRRTYAEYYAEYLELPPEHPGRAT